MEHHAAEAVEAIGDTGQRPSQTLEMQKLTAETQIQEVQGANFSRMAEQALARAVERPHSESTMSLARSDLSNSGSGLVGQAKDGIVSDVTRPGVPEKVSADDSEVTATQQEDRIKTLYLDLTNYQIAWKIAQRLQQDVTQLMKGS